jgi:hypothetical protein
MHSKIIIKTRLAQYQINQKIINFENASKLDREIGGVNAASLLKWVLQSLQDRRNIRHMALR